MTYLPPRLPAHLPTPSLPTHLPPVPCPTYVHTYILTYVHTYVRTYRQVLKQQQRMHACDTQIKTTVHYVALQCIAVNCITTRYTNTTLPYVYVRVPANIARMKAMQHPQFHKCSGVG